MGNENDYTNRAQNMAVVDIRENRILSITPTNRSISQIQSRDTSDVPLLYVYELDPLPNNNNDDTTTTQQTQQDDISSNDNQTTTQQQQQDNNNNTEEDDNNTESNEENN